MKGLSLRTWRLVQALFPGEAAQAAQLLVERCGQNLPFMQDRDEHQLERIRFAALKISGGSLQKLDEAIGIAQRDWRDVLVWAGFGNSLTEHERWAEQVLSR
jgi:hypothetical protein